jgi:predicted permease
MWIRALVSRSRVEREMEREMRAHIDMETENNVALGMTQEEARRKALVTFGGMDAQREAVRDERGTRWLDDLLADTRFALRLMRLRPGFTALAAITLAIGIGVTTVVYSWANYTLYRPVPGVREASGVAEFAFEKEPGRPTGISVPNIDDLGALSHDITSIAGQQPTSAQVAGGSSAPATVQAAVVTAEYFHVLGVRPATGRFFSADESRTTSTSRTVVIGDSLREAMFAGAPNVLGQRLRVNAVDFTVIGVVPRNFSGVDRSRPVDLWFPPAAYAVLHHSTGLDLGDRHVGAFMTVVARLRDGVTPVTAQTEMRAVMAHLAEVYPDADAIFKECLPTVYGVLGVPTYTIATVRHTLRLLLGAVGLVLLIACANTANLLLFRGLRRRGEFAVRRALGASRGRIIRQHLIEGLLLSLAGAVLGILFALALGRVFATQRILGLPPLGDMPMDWRVVAFALCVCLLTGVVFGIIPAVSTLQSDYLAQLKQAARATIGGVARLRAALTVIQIALAVALVIGATLVTRTLLNLEKIQLGFDPSHVSVAFINPDPQGYSAARAAVLRRTLVEQIGAQAGVQTVSWGTAAPLAGGAWFVDYATVPNPGKVWPVQAQLFSATPQFLATLSIPIVRGRLFTSADTSSDREGIVVSRRMASVLFGNKDPVGQTLYERGFTGAVRRVVVGVAGDIRTGEIRSDMGAVAYQPLALAPPFGEAGYLFVRSTRSPVDVAKLIGSAVASFDPVLPVGTVKSMDDVVAETFSSEQLLAKLLNLVSSLAVLLSGVGLYGLIAYAVSERTREIGVRMALGARAASVVALVGRRVAALVITGLCVGAAAAVLLSRTLESTLFGVPRLDPATYAGAGIVAVLIGVAASAIPSMLATRVNPVDALRSE